MAKKRVNPHKRPASQADVKRASKQAQEQAVNIAIAMFLTVMFDKFGFDAEQLQRVWKEVNSLSDSVAKGYVNVQDLMTVLDEEYNVKIT